MTARPFSFKGAQLDGDSIRIDPGETSPIKTQPLHDWVEFIEHDQISLGNQPFENLSPVLLPQIEENTPLSLGQFARPDHGYRWHMLGLG